MKLDKKQVQSNTQETNVTSVFEYTTHGWEKRFDEEFPGEFITFEDGLARIETRAVTLNEIKQFLATELANAKKEVAEKINLIKTKHKNKHICRFNDGEQNCECYLEGLNRVLRQLNHTKGNNETK